MKKAEEWVTVKCIAFWKEVTKTKFVWAPRILCFPLPHVKKKKKKKRSRRLQSVSRFNEIGVNSAIFDSLFGNRNSLEWATSCLLYSFYTCAPSVSSPRLFSPLTPVEGDSFKHSNLLMTLMNALMCFLILINWLKNYRYEDFIQLTLNHLRILRHNPSPKMIRVHFPITLSPLIPLHNLISEMLLRLKVTIWPPCSDPPQTENTHTHTHIHTHTDSKKELGSCWVFLLIVSMERT